jgi:NAD(P)-dependent dehydrogenase (short-subunit alcohol dehydrogenase family)
MSKVVLITGVSSGIGNATAKLFHQEGWHVIGVSRTRTDHIDGVDHYIPADVSKIEDLDRVFDEIKSEEGRIDSLVNNAALQICKSVLETTVNEWDAIFNTNVRSVFYCSKLAHPLMVAKGGSIVNVSSVHAIATSANIAAYAASKGAIKTLTRNIAIEFAQDKIRVNAVLPGAIDTPMLQAGLNRVFANDNINILNKASIIAEKTVLGRIGAANDVATAILFLADETRSGFIAGQSLIIDGGATAKLSTE